MPPEPTKFKTCRRFDDPGHAHALTFSCFRRQPFLARERPCQWLVETINQARTKHGFDVWAYVFMPEHVHLLIWPRNPAYRISEILKDVKWAVTRRAVAHLTRTSPDFLDRMLDEQPNGRRHHRFWQRGGGYDRNIWSESAVAAEIDYAHLNPVRRSLCVDPTEWYWSSAADYLAGRQGPLAINFESLPRIVHIERPR